MPHKNYTIAEAVEWVNCTVRDTWANIYTVPARTNLFGDFLVDKLCTGEVVESSEFVQWTTHPATAKKYIPMLLEIFNGTKRPFVIDGAVNHIWLLISNPLRDYLGTVLNGFILPPPTANEDDHILTTAIWELDCEAEKHPFVVPGPITTLIVRSNLIAGASDLNELCTCVVPPEEHAAIQLGLSTGTMWKRVKSSANLKAIHLVITTADGRRMPFKGGVIYYLLYFRPC